MTYWIDQPLPLALHLRRNLFLVFLEEEEVTFDLHLTVWLMTYWIDQPLPLALHLRRNLFLVFLKQMGFCPQTNLFLQIWKHLQLPEPFFSLSPLFSSLMVPFRVNTHRPFF